jgi:protein O-GlcNAc transferase
MPPTAQSLLASGQLDQAEALARRTLQRSPNDIESLYILGQVLLAKGQASQAQYFAERMLALNPALSSSRHLLARTLLAQKRPEDAVRHLRDAEKLTPDALTLRELAKALTAAARHAEAEAVWRRVLLISPKGPEAAIAHAGLAGLLIEAARTHEGVDHARRATLEAPDEPTTAAIYAFFLNYDDRALPHDIAAAHRTIGSLLSRRLGLPQTPIATQLQNRGIAGTNVPPVQNSPAPSHDRSTRAATTTKIRLAYLSPDFRTHSVASFILPLFEHHDRSRFELFALSCTARQDDITARFKAAADHFLDVTTLSDEALAAKIRALNLDILIDLAGHMRGSRAFALPHLLTPIPGPKAPIKTATNPTSPLIITYCGYPNTTGLPAITHRITDAIADPPPHTDHLHTESLIRLPAPAQAHDLTVGGTGVPPVQNGPSAPHAQHTSATENPHAPTPGCFLCYQPDHDAPEPAYSPTLPHQLNPAGTNLQPGGTGVPPVQNGPALQHTSDAAATATAAPHAAPLFVSFNTSEKLSPSTLDLFAGVLHATPNSSLLLKARAFADAFARDSIRAALHSRGIHSSRLHLLAWTPTRTDHLALYNHAAVALDPTPYNGTTTTCEALWMGVPVITLRLPPERATHASRVGQSLLTTLNLTDFIADSPTDYITKATTLANNPAHLHELRKTLRPRMQSSPLCNAKAFTATFEQALVTTLNATTTTPSPPKK